MKVDPAVGPLPDAQGAEQPVGLDQLGAEHLGQFAARQTAQHLHLEEAVLGVHVAEGEVGVVLILRVDVGDAPLVAGDLRLGLERGVRERAIELRHACLGEIDEPNADDDKHYDQRDDPTYKDDAVEFFVNPKPSQDFYYGLEMNARATLYDYFYAYPQLLLKRLDFTGVQLATHIDVTLNQTGDKDKGWTLEVAIPWKNFEELGANAAPKPGAVWTANLNRWDGTEPNRRLSLWSDSGLKNPSPHNPKRFGQLIFVE